MQTRQQLIDFLTTQSRRVHFVGIGGCGMSGLARLLIQQGHQVTGSDLNGNGETTVLRKLGAKIHVGHAGKHVHRETELVVYTSAVTSDNPELLAALEHKIPAVRRGVLLTGLMTHQHNIAVAGTHGKTTTTAMIAYVLTRSDSSPSYCVGGNVPVLGTNAQFGAGKYFVAEADESDGTLIGFTPQYSVCLNIEAEHLDHHRSMDGLLANFEVFFRSTLNTVFYCADCTNCVTLAQQSRAAISFGLSDRADYRAHDVTPTSRGCKFIVTCRGQQLGEIELVIPGKQNVVNALAAIAVADQLGMPFEKVAEALGKFTGAKRRFERRYEGEGIVVVDDYAHHPTEIRATIAAAKTLGFQRVVVAFQPHRFTRTQALLPEFGSAFYEADKLFLTEIYAASEKPIKGITGETLRDTVIAAGQVDVTFERDLQKLAQHLCAEAHAGDLILVMGAGDISKVAQAVAEKLAARRATKPVKLETAMNIQSDVQGMLSELAVVRPEEPMARHTSLRVGGPAELWVEPGNERDLAKLLKYCHQRNIPVTIVGRGTNLLVRDGGIPGVVIHLASAEFSKVEVDGDSVIARGGARLKGIVNTAKHHELGGLEFLEGIPGSVGGALRMNAGAMGKQTFDVVEWVRYVSFAGEIYDADAKSLPVGYRSCPLFANHVVLSVILRGEKTARAVIDSRLRQFEQKRWASQPARPSAGCIFKNPREVAAGKLIDDLGLKGTSVGAARVSEMHGNFIVNEGGATAGDVLKLIEVIRAKARQERGIELEPEVMILGRES
ncbi:MAG: UDP-N-acetylmuramate--L-alanine ligase [Verrucomicrobiae bacterium]|nr:UDP-N-acetylmuramate--L-alanine ligase [Verrucomicrobiae bacterium]